MTQGGKLTFPPAPRRQANSLAAQAAALATGTDPSSLSSLNPVTLSGALPIDSLVQGLVHQFQLVAYYTPSKEFFDFTDRVMSINWTDAAGQAGQQGTIQLDNHDGLTGSYANRPGLIPILNTAGPDGIFNEWERWVVSQSDATDLGRGIITWSIYDSLIYLQHAVGSWSYTPDKAHRHGWTASEIAINILRALGAPFSVVQSDYRIPYFAVQQVSAYDAIAKAFTIDYRKSGKFFWINSVKGIVTISRVHAIAHQKASPRAQDQFKNATNLGVGGGPAPGVPLEMPVVDIDLNVTSADFIRQLPETLYTAIIPAGATPLTSTGKPQSNLKLATIGAAKSSQEQAVIQSISGSGARTATQVLPATPKPTPPVASILFGTLNYDGHRDKIGTVQDPGWTRSALQTLANQFSKMVKTVQVTTPLNIYMAVGNRVLCRLRFAGGNIFQKELFITSIDKRIDTSGPMMDVTFSWRFLDAVPIKDITDVQAKAAPKLPKGLTGQSSGSRGSTGTVAKIAGNPFSSNQLTFAAHVVQGTGLSGHLIMGWMSLEEPVGASTNTDPTGHGAQNWLNIGITDTASYGAGNPCWRAPGTAGDASAAWIRGKTDQKGVTAPSYGPASAGIQAVIRTAGQSVAAQVAALAASGWASSGYPGLAGAVATYGGDAPP